VEFRLGNLRKNPPFSLPLTGAPSFASLPTLREEHSSTSPNPCFRTVSDLRASYVLRTASNGLLPKWEKGSRSQSPSLPLITSLLGG